MAAPGGVLAACAGRAEQAVHVGARGGRLPAAAHRARLSGRAVVRWGLVRVPGRRAATAAEPVQDDRLLVLPPGAAAVPQPDPGHHRPAPDGAGGRGDDLRAAAPLPGLQAVVDGRRPARAARWVRDRGRAPDHGRGAVHVPAHDRHAADPVAAAGVLVGGADRRAVRRLRRGRADRRRDRALGVPAVPRHSRLAQPARLASSGRDGGRVPRARRRIRELVPPADRSLQHDAVRRLLPVGTGVVVRELRGDQADRCTSECLPDRSAVQADPAGRLRSGTHPRSTRT